MINYGKPDKNIKHKQGNANSGANHAALEPIGTGFEPIFGTHNTENPPRKAGDTLPTNGDRVET
jgi:hypothetical protein